VGLLSGQLSIKSGSFSAKLESVKTDNGQRHGNQNEQECKHDDKEPGHTPPLMLKGKTACRGCRRKTGLQSFGGDEEAGSFVIPLQPLTTQRAKHVCHP